MKEHKQRFLAIVAVLVVLSWLFTACGGDRQTDENKAVTRRWIEEGANEQNISVADETVAADFVYHNTDIRGIAGFKQNFSAIFAAFPDAHWTIDDQIAEGDKVVVRMTFQGTHEGQWMGIPPTGKHLTWKMIVIFRLADGKIAEMWANWDTLGAFQQLGFELAPPLE